MRGLILSAACVGAALSVHAADIGGYFHEERKRESQSECAGWIAAAQKTPPAELQYRVGLCYWNGWGVPEDRVAAEAWLRKAAERGHADAQLSLGDLVYLDDTREAYRWYAIAAEANHPGAHLRRERAARLLNAAELESIKTEIQLERRKK